MKIMKYFTVLIPLLLAGCGPNWEELAPLIDKEYEATARWANGVNVLIADKPSGNAGEAAHVAYQMRMFGLQQDLVKLKPNVLQSVLNYDLSWRQEIRHWTLGILNAPITNRLLCEFPFDCNNSGTGGIVVEQNGSDNTLEFVGASDRGIIAQDEAIAASDESQVTQDGSTAAQHDGQIQEGDGVQGQAFTDPPNLPGFDNRGGNGGAGEGSTGGNAGTPVFDSGTGVELPTVGQ